MDNLFRHKVELIDIDRLVPYPQNAKKHDDKQVNDIAAQILQAGWDQPIVIESDMTIIKGHGRYLAAKKLKLQKVPVIVSDLSKEKARAVRLADNKVAEAPWDEEMLKKEMAELQAMDDFDMAMTAFDDDEIDSLFAPSDDDLDMSVVETGSTAQVQSTVENLAKSVRKAIQIDFHIDDYEEAIKLAKRLRDSGVYLGGLFLMAMRNHERLSARALENQKAV